MAKKKAKKKTAKKAAKKTTKKVAAKAAKVSLTGTTKRASAKLGPLDKKTLSLIETTAERVKSSIERRNLPELKFPVRSLSNVTYDKRKGFFELGKGRKARALSVNTVKNFAQTLRLMSISKEMIENNDFATKREAYYVSKNWAEAKFNEQTESDSVMDDIEALEGTNDGVCVSNIYSEQHGGHLAPAPAVVQPKDTGKHHVQLKWRSTPHHPPAQPHHRQSAHHRRGHPQPTPRSRQSERACPAYDSVLATCRATAARAARQRHGQRLELLPIVVPPPPEGTYSVRGDGGARGGRWARRRR